MTQTEFTQKLKEIHELKAKGIMRSENDFVNEDLSGVFFDKLDLRDITFFGCEFNSVTVWDCRFDGASFEKCSFSNIDFRGCNFTCASFRSCTWDGVDFEDSNMSSVCFVNSDLSKTNLGLLPYFYRSKVNKEDFIDRMVQMCFMLVDDEDCRKIQAKMRDMAFDLGMPSDLSRLIHTRGVDEYE